ncbi:MAG: (S)-2-hydroxyglutarate dehydrogenase [Solirubrobacteraceae bacterium]|nr:(S)-2-hydroxyglutarate dehydrogenase [Solirubrobacteraceae bacterium]
MADPPERCHLAVVGAGILGLSVAGELARRHPGAKVCVLEREAAPALHQSGRNSGVIHAGVYYAPGSLKARLCVEGARAMYEFCAAHGVRHERCGKLILATTAREVGRLDELERRAAANGVEGLRRLDAAAVREVEPHAAGVAGLHSANTGVVDFAEVTRALVGELEAAGGAVAAGCGVRRVAAAGRVIRLEHARGTLEAGAAVFCAGAWADRLAVAAGAPPDPRIVPFRGAYLRLAPERRALVRALIYPVPDPRLPFLGVHLTRDVHGEVLIGPTALVAAGRDGRPRASGRWRDLAATLAWPGTWRMAGAQWRAGLTELGHAASRPALMRAAARLVPELGLGDAVAAFAGVRAQAVGYDGRLIDDFVFSATPRALHVRNAPSPGATAALAIARHVADQADRAFA